LPKRSSHRRNLSFGATVAAGFGSIGVGMLQLCAAYAFTEHDSADI
jgi:hypothetical protein